MKWLDIGGAIVNFDSVIFIIKNINEQDNIYAIRFHYSTEMFLETKFQEKEFMETFYININNILSNGKSGLGTPPQDAR